MARPHLSRIGGDGTALLLAAWSLVVVGDSLNRGDWEIAAVVCIGIGFLLAAAVAWRRLPVRRPGRRQLAVPVLACVLAAVVHPAAASMQMAGTDLHVVQGVAAATAVLAAVTLLADPAWRRVGLGAVATGFVATGALVFAFVPHPDIDVWAILQQSSSGLLHGDDMYRQHWVDGYGLKTVYPYLPFSTLSVLPFHVVFGDVRVGMLAFLLLAAWLLRRMAPAAPAALAALPLVAPHTAYYLLRSWTEPELTVLLFVTVLLLDRRRPTWAMLTLGLALASKQPVVLLLPLFAVWPGFGWRRAAGAAGIGFAVALPWLLAGPSAMWHDAVTAQLGLGTLDRALSIPSGLARAGIHLGFGLLVVVLAAVYLIAWRRLPRTPAGLALGCALVGLGYALANTQSFFNHYQLPAAMLLAAVALSGAAGESGAGGVTAAGGRVPEGVRRAAPQLVGDVDDRGVHRPHQSAAERDPRDAEVGELRD